VNNQYHHCQIDDVLYDVAEQVEVDQWDVMQE
jgi:hypothetical protein